MDQDTLVKEFHKLVLEYNSKVGEINLLLLLPDADHNTYTVLFSSYLLDNIGAFNATKTVIEFFHDRLSNDTFKCISRINVIHSEDESVRSINKFINLEGFSISKITDCIFFNVYIPSGILLVSKDHK